MAWWYPIAAGAASAIGSSLLNRGGGDGIDVSENRRLIQMQRQEQQKQRPLDRAHYRATMRSHWSSLMGMARKHGIHPLYALGVQPGAAGGGSPSIIAGQTGSSGGYQGDFGFGQATSNYLNRKQIKQQQQLQNAESMSRAAANFAQAQYYASLGARVEQRANAEQDLTKVAMDQVQRIPDTELTVNPRDTSQSAGVDPSWKRQALGDAGPFIEWPAKSPMSADELTSPGTILMLLRNMGFFQYDKSPKQTTEMTKHHFRRRGMKPKKRYYERLQGNW